MTQHKVFYVDGITANFKGFGPDYHKPGLVKLTLRCLSIEDAEELRRLDLAAAKSVLHSGSDSLADLLYTGARTRGEILSNAPPIPITANSADRKYHKTDIIQKPLEISDIGLPLIPTPESLAPKEIPEPKTHQLRPAYGF